LLFDLGLDETEIVGRTKFCIRPTHRIDGISIVGGTKTAHVHKILASAPSLVLANIDENNEDTIERIERNTIPVFVTHPNRVEDSMRMIIDIGTLLRATDAARDLVAETHAAVAHFSRGICASVLYLIWRDPYMTVGPGTYIDDVLRLTGYRNVVDAHWCGGGKDDSPGACRYPSLEIHNIVELQPESILLSSEPYPFQESHIRKLRDELGNIDPEYAAKVRIRLVDGEMYSWYGSRLVHVFREDVARKRG